MKTVTLLNELAECYAGLSPDSLPPDVMRKARRSFADFVGTLVIGYRKGILPPLMNAYLRARPTPGHSTWLSMGDRTAPEDAAMSMGVASHAVELDDGHRFGTSHPAVAVIPAALAVAEQEGRSLRDFLYAVVIGYDGMLRLARSINPSHLKRGFHSTGTCGAVGSAWATGVLMGLDRDRLAHAAAIGALQSAGIQEMLHDNPAIKPLQAGRAAANGVLAASLARRGARGPSSVFEGAHGWCRAFTDDFRRDELVRGLGSDFEILHTYTKLYPTCRHCHASIDLALQARRELACEPDDISAIHIRTYDVAISEVGGIYEPATFDDAMFSLPFSVALALAIGRVSLHDYSEENYRREDLRRLQRRLTIEADAQMNARYPRERGAHMRIELSSGRAWERETALPKGEPETPVTDEELREKFMQCVVPYFPAERALRAWQGCVEFDADDALGSVIRALDPAGLAQ